MIGREPRTIPIQQVDAFTTRPFTGNPAGVVLDAEGLTDGEMQLVAREMNLSETAFLLPPTVPGADLRIRWMTPSSEVDLCGHATVATFHAALETGRLAAGEYRMECRSGILPIGLSRAGDGAVVRMGLPVPRIEEMDLAACRIAEPLGIESEDIDARHPIARAGEWILVPLTGMEAMRRVRPDFKALRGFGEEIKAGCFIVLTRETVDPDNLVHVRMFAPAWGIDEDPVTGSAEGPVAAWLHRRRLLEGPRYTAEQGDVIGRPGRISVEVEAEPDRIRSIAISGRAVTVLRGTLTLPPRS